MENIAGGSRHVGRLVVAVVVAMLMLTGCGDSEDTTLKQTQGDGFSVLMPANARRSEQSVKTAAGDLKTVIWLSERTDGASSVSYTELPDGTPTSLDGAVDGSANSIKGTVTSKTTGTLADVETREATISNVETDGFTGTAFETFFITRNRLYAIQTISSGDVQGVPQLHTDVRNSFTLN